MVYSEIKFRVSLRLTGNFIRGTRKKIFAFKQLPGGNCAVPPLAGFVFLLLPFLLLPFSYRRIITCQPHNNTKYLKRPVNGVILIVCRLKVRFAVIMFKDLNGHFIIKQGNNNFAVICRALFFNYQLIALNNFFYRSCCHRAR
ncbi:MAG: hypothetical protein UZ05_CHB002001456 [Chlorobi bacterium OLB5]|nr:MAG: hypothetical protein UZ05_CHB002001456 [Chlorobi bacterium OLB5]